MSEQNRQEHIEVIKDIGTLMGSLMRESERAAVILAAARIDVDLERLLKHVLHRHPGGSDSLFDSDRALGTFSAKISLAHRLGLVDQDFEHSLQILRKIRNDFAHQLESESLSSIRQKPRLNELVRWVQHTDVYRSNLELPRPEGKSLEHAQFIACVIYMAIVLKSGLNVFQRLNIGKPLGTQ